MGERRLKKHTFLITAWLFLFALSSFQFLAPPSVLVQWETQSETNSAGFNLYRQQAHTLMQTQLNSTLIPSQGNSSRGATYRFTDKTVQKGKTYVYYLEEIELDGTAVFHPTFNQTATVPRFPSWLLLPVGGVVILTIHTIRESRKTR